MPRLFANFRYKLLALGLALFLWMVAQGSSSIERGFDIPVVLNGIPERLVVTDKSVDAVNLRVMGTRAALRSLSPADLDYRIDVAGAKPGVSDYEVDVSRLDLPRGARIVSRSPSRIELRFETRAMRAVRVRPDIEGEPAEGFEVASIGIEPSRVQITGARSEVLRLSEVVTETVDITGARDPIERQVRVSLGGGHVWTKDSKPVRVRVEIEATEPATGDAAQGSSEPPAG